MNREADTTTQSEMSLGIALRETCRDFFFPTPFPILLTSVVKLDNAGDRQQVSSVTRFFVSCDVSLNHPAKPGYNPSH